MKPFFIPCAIATLVSASSLTGAESLVSPVDPSKTPKGLTHTDWSGIREAYEHNRHSFVVNSDGTHQARNPGQTWLTLFDGRGFTVKPDGGGWSWGLDLKGYGYPGHEQTVAGSSVVKTDGGRLEYQHDENLKEWFVNDSRGLEQGWTLQHRPEGYEAGVPLKLEIALRGGLKAQVATDGGAVAFVDPSGSNVIQYSDLKAWDADGKTVPVNFESGENGFRVVADDAGAKYPITIDPIAQQAYLKASNTGAGDFFGSSVAVSGYTVVVGAYREASGATGVNGDQTDNSVPYAGAAYVFVRSGNSWIQQAYLKASNTGRTSAKVRGGDSFGAAVAISGDTIVIGASGEDSNGVGVNGSQTDNSAFNAGAAYVFVRNGTTWVQQAYLKASNAEAEDIFGQSVAVSGDTLIVGASAEDSGTTGVGGNQIDNSADRAGAAYVFFRNGSTWTQQAFLKASNTGALDRFGCAVAASGDTVAVAAYGESSNATGVNGNENDNSLVEAGAGYVFVRNGTTWSQQAYLKASNTGVRDVFGKSIALSGDTVVVGAPAESTNAVGVNGDQADNSAIRSGAAYVFVRSGLLWGQQAYLKPSVSGIYNYAVNEYPAVEFGTSVAVSGDTVVVGAVGEDSNATGVNGDPNNFEAFQSGAAYAFVRNGSLWSQEAYLKASDSPGSKHFGSSVGVSGDLVISGAVYESSGSTGVNGIPANNPLSFSESGAAYLFNGVGTWFSLSTIAANGIATGAGDYKTGSTASVTVTPHPGYVFSSWSGDATGNNNPLSVLVDSNKIITANFGQDTSDPDEDGLSNYNEIVVHGTDPNVADTDGDGYSDGYEVSFSTNPKNSASVPTFALDLVSNGSAQGGSFTKSGSLAHGTNATVTAVPSSGYLFGNWTNDASGTDSPATILMDSNKIVGATFVQDARDPDGDGLDNYHELVVHGTDPNVADSDGDTYMDGYEIQFGTNPKSGSSIPTYTLNLVNNGSAQGGSFTKSGSFAHGTNATLTATPSPGYVFGKWTGDASGDTNPLTFPMNSNKLVDATFVPDPRDSDGDGLDNYHEIVVIGTNSEKADTDRDGVTDGGEINDKTNPNIADTDHDGLIDGLEKKLKTNPLRKDTDGDGTADADEDQDRDGISNGREVNELGTNPRKADSDGDGLTDGFELAFDGKTEAFTPRIGDRIRLDFKRFEFPGTMRMAGELPAGLRFDPVKQLLHGTLVGKPGSYSLRLQLFDGRSFVRSIPIPFRVAAFPKGLAGDYEGLLETREGVAAGLIAVKIRAPGESPDAEATWTATLDMPGRADVRTSAGSIILSPAADSVDLAMSFPAAQRLEALVVSLRIKSGSALVEGDHSTRDPRTSGSVRGFRLARRARPAGVDRGFTLIIDQGERDGFSIPAGLGWATGSIANSGKITLAGQLGDSQSFKTSARLSVTGQAIVWMKPYSKPNSWLGGIISFRESGLTPSKSKKYQETGLSWFRARDASELSYPQGFGPLQANAGIAAFTAPASAGALAKSLGLTGRTFGEVLIEGGGLPDPKGAVVMPEAFALREDFALVALPVKGLPPVPWHGSIDSHDGTFAGTLKLPASNFGIVAGTAGASGVLIPGAGFEGIVAAGLVKLPVGDRKDAFRTAAIMISK